MYFLFIVVFINDLTLFYIFYFVISLPKKRKYFVKIQNKMYKSGTLILINSSEDELRTADRCPSLRSTPRPLIVLISKKQIVLLKAFMFLVTSLHSLKYT